MSNSERLAVTAPVFFVPSLRLFSLCAEITVFGQLSPRSYCCFRTRSRWTWLRNGDLSSWHLRRRRFTTSDQREAHAQ